MLVCPACHAENAADKTACTLCGRRLSPRGVAPGSVVGGRYEIQGVLGSGGMATVYKAHDRALDVSVALKVLNANPVRDPDLARRFRSEIKLAWRVRHRNVCGIHEYGEDGDLLYISMELVEGKDLKRLLREAGALSWEEACDVAIQIAEGLEAIHEAGVIHRDLKPANITRDTRGIVRLMDFGIAKVWGEDSGAGLTHTGNVVGSPDYMSPEQVRGRSVDFRSDVYALGLVVYELFTGRGPFRGTTPAEAMMRRLEEEPDWDGPAIRQIPPSVLAVLRRSLKREPEDRHASCAEILADLRAARAALLREPTEDLAPGAALAAAAQAPAPARLPMFSRDAQARVLVPPLIRALKHADHSVRLGAAEALGLLASDARLATPGLPAAAAPASRAVEDALEAARLDSDERVRAAAASSLVRLERPAPAPAVPPPAPAQGREPQSPEFEERILARPPTPDGWRAPRWAWVAVLIATALFVLVWFRSSRTMPIAGVADPGLPASVAPDPTPTPTAMPEATASPAQSPTPPMFTATAAPPAAKPSPASTETAPRARPARPTLPGPVLPSAQPTPMAASALEPADIQPSIQPAPEPEPTGVPAPVAVVPSEAPAPIATPALVPVVAPVCLSCSVPEAARVLRGRLGLSGAVRLGVHVSETGEVLRVDYLTGPPQLRDALCKAALRWRYRPARRGEAPVAARVMVDIEF